MVYAAIWKFDTNCADKVGRRPNQTIFVCCVDGWRKYTSGKCE